jgi:protocatechuate 3,4-dioxygenase beta subunit
MPADEGTPRAIISGVRPEDLVSRRSVLVGLAAAATLAACSSGDEAKAGDGRRPSSTTGPRTSGTTAAPASGSVLTPELTAGPYYLDGPAVRRDITEGRPGAPLELRVRVQDRSCRPVANAAVDVWHCDAGGEYSGFVGNSLAETSAGGTNDLRYLRGIQMTDRDGVATFDTIYPGWYEGRAVHIHLRVHVGGTANGTYQGGHIAHTGQLFFDDALTDRVVALDPYAAHSGTRTLNSEDSIYADAGTAAVASLRPRVRGDVTRGYVGELACVVDPAASPPES